MEVSSALVKNAKPTPKKRVGRPALNDTISSLDTSFSPKRPRKPLIYERLYLILDMTDMNTELFIGKISQDAFYVKKTRLGCSKCEKGLCLTKDRNCFTNFHDIFDC